MGNPPYSIGDDNQNESYPELEKRIGETYAEQASKGGSKKSLYDSYIKAFRWASDRLPERGVIAFVTNAGWIGAVAASGMRRCLQKEFSSVYVYHLKGNHRTSGEQTHKEGGKIFDKGSRTPIAITILVKNPNAQEQGKIYFATVDDYLSREQKLNQLVELGSILNVPLVEIHPDVHGDWLNQRRDDFGRFITVDGKKTGGLAVFANHSRGIETGRDAWSYNASKNAIAHNFTGCIALYNAQVKALQANRSSFVRENDETKIKWNTSLSNRLKKLQPAEGFSQTAITNSIFRPFVKLWLYNDKTWLNNPGQIPKFFHSTEQTTWS